MRRRSLILSFLVLCLALVSCDRLADAIAAQRAAKSEHQTKTVADVTSPTFAPIAVTYPNVRRDSGIVDNYHGKSIADPYRWLEDDQAAETKQWVQTQNRVTDDYLAQIPFRDELTERLAALWNYKRVAAPQKKGDRYYTLQNDGLQQQDILYTQEDLGSELVEVLNPNQFSADGTASLGGYAFSQNNDYLAYEISAGGADWRTIKIKDLRTGQVLADDIRWVKFNNISWAGNGFFYSRYPAPVAQDELAASSEFHQVWYHRVGTAQSEDELVFADRAHPQRNFYISTTPDERFLILRMIESTSGNALYFRDLQSDDDAFVPIVESFEHDFFVVDSDGDKLLVLTNHNAPNWRLVQISTRYPAPAYWEEIIPTGEHVLQRVQVLNQKIVATYIQNASSQVKIFELDGKPIGTLPLPEIGTVQQIRGARDAAQIFIEFASLTRPTTVYTSNLNSLDMHLWSAPDIDFESGNFVTRQAWFKSYDGTSIPMFITHRKGLPLDGNRPTLLYGYGGFNISLLPQFNLTRLHLGTVFMEQDGVYAVPNLRGGGEFGANWHRAGTKEQKQNVFNDF
ncbi:MAG: prolyl oligopeptidase family serine peptidase, partial [Bacteroidota bacterium]